MKQDDTTKETVEEKVNELYKVQCVLIDKDMSEAAMFLGRVIELIKFETLPTDIWETNTEEAAS